MASPHQNIVLFLSLALFGPNCAGDLDEILDTEDSLGGVVGPVPDLGSPCNQSNPDRSGRWNVISNPASECERNVCLYYHAYKDTPTTCEHGSDCRVDDRDDVLRCRGLGGSDNLGECTLDEDFVKAHSYCSGACRDSSDCKNPISGHACTTRFTCKTVNETGSKACVCDEPPPAVVQR